MKPNLPTVSTFDGHKSSSLFLLGRVPSPVEVVLALTLAAVFLSQVAGAETLRIRGRWVLAPDGTAISSPEPGFREQGLQTSGLSYDGQSLWAIGDQRSVIPSTIVRIDPETGRLQEPFFPLQLTSDTLGDGPPRLEQGKNPDFEGLAVTGDNPRRFFAVIESDGPYIVKGVLDHLRNEARITEIFSIQFEPEPAGGDANSRLEGIAVHGHELWLAYERDGNGVPHLYHGSLPENSIELVLKPIELPLHDLPDRPDKGRINFNGLDVWDDGSPIVVLVLRDQERLLFYRVKTGALSFLDVDFRSPDNSVLKWTSPEGIAVDPDGDRLWVVSDPDSLRGNYRLEQDRAATGLFRKMVPLLFEVPLGRALRSAQSVATSEE